MALDDMPRGLKVMIYVVGTLNELKALGLVRGPDRLTVNGEMYFTILKAQGFEPTTEEMQEALEVIKEGGFTNEA